MVFQTIVISRRASGQAVACPVNSAGSSVPSECSCNAGYSGSVSAITSRQFLCCFVWLPGQGGFEGGPRGPRGQEEARLPVKPEKTFGKLMKTILESVHEPKVSLWSISGKLTNEKVPTVLIIQVLARLSAAQPNLMETMFQQGAPATLVTRAL
jgi:hypothetical protein